MDAITVFVGRHPALTYFVMTFAISWGGTVPMTRSAQPPRAPPAGDRLFRELFIASAGAR